MCSIKTYQTRDLGHTGDKDHLLQREDLMALLSTSQKCSVFEGALDSTLELHHPGYAFYDRQEERFFKGSGPLSGLTLIDSDWVGLRWGLGQRCAFRPWGFARAATL